MVLNLFLYFSTMELFQAEMLRCGSLVGLLHYKFYLRGLYFPLLVTHFNLIFTYFLNHLQRAGRASSHDLFADGEFWRFID
jgi:hypothetical protein